MVINKKKLVAMNLLLFAVKVILALKLAGRL